MPYFQLSLLKAVVYGELAGCRLQALVEREAQVEEGVRPDGRAGGEQQAHLDGEALFHLEHGSTLNITYE